LKDFREQETDVSSEKIFREVWADIMVQRPAATAATGVYEVDYKEFSDKVLNADRKAAEEICNRIYEGQIHVFQNAFSSADLQQLKDKAYAWVKAAPMQEPPLIEQEVENYCSRRTWHSEESGGYSSVYDMLHFYRWNDDPLGVFPYFDDKYRFLHVINGYSESEFRANKPKDGVVHRVEISHYPTGVGGIGFHSDPLSVVKFQITLNLNQYGEDFHRGGFAVGTPDGGILRVEPYLKLGSLVGFLPSICHGVEVIDPNKPIDWEGPTGRWYVGVSLVTTHAVKNREFTKPVANYPSLREQVLAAQAEERS
jgi:hypothetical protein